MNRKERDDVHRECVNIGAKDCGQAELDTMESKMKCTWNKLLYLLLCLLLEIRAHNKTKRRSLRFISIYII